MTTDEERKRTLGGRERAEPGETESGTNNITITWNITQLGLYWERGSVGVEKEAALGKEPREIFNPV